MQFFCKGCIKNLRNQYLNQHNLRERLYKNLRNQYLNPRILRERLLD